MKINHVYAGLLLSGLVVLSFAGNCHGSEGAEKKKQAYPAFYHAGLIADGNPAGWPSKMFYLHAEANVLYAVANDSSHLYFCLEILDKPDQAVILHEGITLFLDPMGRKKETCSLKISTKPFTPDVSQGPSAGNIQQKTLKHKPQRFVSQLTAAGFSEKFNGLLDTGINSMGFIVAVAFDSAGALIIEGCIPQKAFPEDVYRGKCLSIGFNIEKREKGSADRGQQGGNPVDGAPGGMKGGNGSGGGMQGGGHSGGNGKGGGRGGEMGGHGGQASSHEQQDKTKTFRIWHKFSIAPSP